MNREQALEVLKQLHDWRNNKRDDCDYSQQDLTQALNIAIEVMEHKTIQIERIEEIIISTAPAPAKLNQIMILIEKYKK